MTDNDDLSNLDGGALRKRLEEVLAKNAELKTQVDTLSASTRSYSVKEALQAKGVTNLKSAQWFPADLDPNDSEGVAKFIEDYSDTINFGISTGSASTDTTNKGNEPQHTSTQVDASVVDEQKRLQQFNQATQAGQQGTPRNEPSEKAKEVISKFAGKSAYEIAQIGENNF